MKALLGPCKCQGCGRTVVWLGLARGWRTLPKNSLRADGISMVEHKCPGTLKKAVPA